jgi:hypothetical protein
MAMTKNASIKWRSEPEKHDYSAAESYLSLTLGQQAAKGVAANLKRAKISKFAAKDIYLERPNYRCLVSAIVT